MVREERISEGEKDRKVIRIESRKDRPRNRVRKVGGNKRDIRRGRRRVGRERDASERVRVKNRVGIGSDSVGQIIAAIVVGGRKPRRTVRVEIAEEKSVAVGKVEEGGEVRGVTCRT